MAIGNPITLTSNVASKTISITATASQTLFTVTGGYRINQLSVYRNGVRLVDGTDYTARDGASVTLLSAATEGDVLEFQIFDDFRVSDAIVSAEANQTINGNLTVTGTLTGAGDINITGVATAASFSGNLTGNATTAGYATTAGIATVAQGLTGSPNIVVGNIVGSGATFTNLTVNGTQTIINTTSLEIADKTVGIASTSSPSDSLADGAGIVVYGTTNKTLFYDNTRKGWDFNIPLTTDEVRFYNVAEKLTRIDGNTVNLVYSTNGSNIGLATNPTGDITLNVTGIPTDSSFDNHVITFNVFVTNTGTARSCTAINLNGTSRTINWAGGSLAAAISGVTTTTGIDIYSFTGINTIGSASTTANYRVLGVVNGGYR